MTVDIFTRFKVITCPNSECGLTFAVTEDWANKRREDHATFYCPNRHPMSYSGKNEEEKLRDALEREKRCCELNRARAASLEEQVEHRAGQIRGYRGHIAKMKKRSVPS